MNSKLKKAFENVGENCPFKLARELGIKLEHKHFELENWCGGYMYNRATERHYIIINSKMDNDTQESTCLLLVQQHLLHEGVELSINVDYLRDLNRIDREVIRCLKLVAEAFLGFTKVGQRA